MHELGIAESILNKALDAATENNAASVKAIGLKIGAFSGVEPQSLEFALECIKAGTPANNSEINIEIIAASGVCGECGKTSAPDTFLSLCGHCGSPVMEIISGKELEISYVDVE
ncbi:MAG: hydrogenase maturation nickel metallochaperone HypA [Deferribacteraceae bacterium]|jgi:hydrogenase nickel incorporation protein HypA/HybF|nr:hydrogenase maturation nickel metallochaperone HypA [Deferribacteraceae bacterium]